MVSEHFKEKGAIEHVAEVQLREMVSKTEIHGIEQPGSISALTDAARETVIALFLSHLLLFNFPISQQVISLGIFICGWFFWKIGRSAWLGWSRLERLHRMLEEERWEIEHNREQEREELKVIHQAKGFEGALLEEVLDVLMADNERLLKIMVEEELGLSLETYEHPLKQGLGAGLGVLLSSSLALLGFRIWPAFGFYLTTLLILAISAAISAFYQGNRLIPAIIWMLGIGALALASSYFLLEYMNQ